MRGEYFLEKVLFFGDPGIDDSFAIMYGLLHPEIEIVGIVTGYGNVEHIHATHNAAYILQLAQIDKTFLSLVVQQNHLQKKSLRTILKFTEQKD